MIGLWLQLFINLSIKTSMKDSDSSMPEKNDPCQVMLYGSFFPQAAVASGQGFYDLNIPGMLVIFPVRHQVSDC
jgi:hypothetical protein